jgi:PAS domain S-box-containing protein
MPGEHANSIGSDMHVRCSGNCNRILASGEMGDRVRNHDWTKTALGPIHSWSEALVVSTNLMLSCQFPSVLLWGAEMIQIYNDASLPLMAEKHPSALGQRAQECWAEAWHIIGPQFEAAFHDGIPTHKENMLVPVIRHGKLQEIYWTYSYSPIYGRDGEIPGVLIVCHDVNAEVAALRNLHASEMLAAQVSRDNEAKLKLATTAAELGIWVWNLQEDRGTWENDRMYEIFGRTRADGPLSHAQFVAHSLHPMEGRHYLQKIENAIKTGEPFVFEGRFYPSGRLPGWVEFQGQLEYGPDGAPWRILGTARDITARKQAEIALQASEERLRLAQTAGKLATWEWDLNTNEFVWSGEVAKIYGLPAEKLTHLDRLTSYLHPEDRNKAMQAVYRAAKKGVEFKHEFRVIRPDGVIRWVAGRGTRVHLAEGRAARVVGINWDITEEKLVEDALLSERKRMEELFRQAPAFIAVVRGPQHVFEMVNLRYHQLVGNRDLLGKAAVEALPEIDDQSFLRLLTQVYESGEPHIEQAARISLLRNEGQPAEDRYVDYLYQPLREPDGTTSGVICLGVDVTERRLAEQALMQNEKLAAVGRLASSIAHEINNPLESVTNLLYLISGSDLLPPALSEYLDTAERELRRVSNIANQTLRFHKQSSDPTAVFCQDLIGDSLSIYQGRIVNGNIHVELRKRAIRPITCFEGEIRQVLGNLVSNAIDAMQPTGGRLICRSKEGTNWRTGKKGLILTIADTGPGMSPLVLKRIFEPFFSTKGIGGSGLGLWISCEIIDRHKGKLTVRSSQREGHKGTVFSIWRARSFVPVG